MRPMMRWADADPTFLVTSQDALPDSAFRGQCFVGGDYIVGSGGAGRFLSLGGSIGPGEDGAYAVLRRVGADEWELGTDYKGFTHVFHHRSADGTWAVSNSLMALARHLRRHGEGARYTPPIAAFGADIDMVRSLMSFHTPVEGVRLLPSTSILRLRPGPRPSLREQRARTEPEALGDYSAVLTRYLDVWSARLQTLLLDSRLRVNAHVTGGRDSRTVLALLLAARQALGSDLPDTLRLTSQRNKPADFAVAQHLAGRYGFALNQRRAGVLPAKLSGFDAFHAWEEMSVGCYAHIMFPLRHRSAYDVVLPGVGGESHRRVYARRIAERPIEKVAVRYRHGFRHERDFVQWRDSLVEADEYLAASPQANTRALVRSHREFRDRFHSGKENFYTGAVLALSSKYLTEASNLLSRSRFASGQVLVDLMANTTPGLLHEPYDHPAKRPAAIDMRRVPRLGWRASNRGGAVFAAEDDHDAAEPGDGPQRPPLSFVLEEARRALEKPAAIDLLGEARLIDGVRSLEQNVAAASQNLHERGRTAHLAYLAGVLAEDG
jgi:hypothetical protein